MSAAASAGTVLDPKRTVLVVVDLQEKLLPAIDAHERVVRNSLLLIRLAQVLDIPVLLTTQNRRGLGDLVPEIRLASPAIPPVDKVAFGCFGSPDFEARVAQLAVRDQFVVAGVEAHICVAQTVLGALAKGFAVHVAADAVGSRTAENRDVGLRRMEAAGAVISSAEMAIYELLGRSDVTAFKAMLPHLRG
jgi:nicotinamidase-related amidase